jgi:membrane-bound metal-dependent hydrolase YbcI (DUF457 family)
MPTPLAHSFCGLIFYPVTQKRIFKNKVYAGAFIVFLSCLTDFDYFVGMFAGDLKFGHRLLTHSLLFPLIVGLVSGISAKLIKKKFLFFFILPIFLITLHIFLDYLSFDNYPQNGIGVPLLWPFSTMFFNFPFHPIAGWFSEGPHEVLFIMINDLYFMIVFAGLFFGLQAFCNRKRIKNAHRRYE